MKIHWFLRRAVVIALVAAIPLTGYGLYGSVLRVLEDGEYWEERFDECYSDPECDLYKLERQARKESPPIGIAWTILFALHVFAAVAAAVMWWPK